MIQGDGINLDSIGHILREATSAGYSASNVAFGMGGQLLQGVNRDTNRFAMKCSSITLDTGEERDVCKDPVTDPGKRSLAGRLDVVRLPSGELAVERLAHGDLSRPDTAMQTVFEDGRVGVRHTLDQVRARAAA